MKAYGDVERVNLSTGERFRRVSGDGESRLVLESGKPGCAWGADGSPANLSQQEEGYRMSWSVSAVGRPAKVAEKIKLDLSAHKCVDPEEAVKQAGRRRYPRGSPSPGGNECSPRHGFGQSEHNLWTGRQAGLVPKQPANADRTHLRLFGVAMRTLTDHRTNPANDALTITVLDEPGHGGACHAYSIEWPKYGNLHIHFQNGPIQEHGVNGVTQEALLAIVIDRLRSFQAGPYACRENAIALTSCEEALMWLQNRTRGRIARGVEGTHQK